MTAVDLNSGFMKAGEVRMIAQRAVKAETERMSVRLAHNLSHSDLRLKSTNKSFMYIKWNVKLQIKVKG